MLKALVLMSTSLANRAITFQSFRGQRAHDFDWLRTRYYQNGGPRFPREINEAFTLVYDWSTDLRYVAGSLRDDDSEGFLAAAANIMRVADGRLLSCPST